MISDKDFCVDISCYIPHAGPSQRKNEEARDLKESNNPNHVSLFKVRKNFWGLNSRGGGAGEGGVGRRDFPYLPICYYFLRISTFLKC